MLLIVYLSLLKLQESLPTYQALLAESLTPIIDWLGNFGITADSLPSSVTDGSAVVNAALAAIGGTVWRLGVLTTVLVGLAAYFLLGTPFTMPQAGLFGELAAVRPTPSLPHFIPASP